MTYPPGGPGYPPASQPTTQFAAPTPQQQFGPTGDAAKDADDAPKLPRYLLITIAVLGVAAYLVSFGPLFSVAGIDFFDPLLFDIGLISALVAALLAGVALIPKQAAATTVIAVLSVLSFLLVLYTLIDAPDEATIEWALYVVIALTLLLAAAAVAALLFDAGVLKAPTPRPKYGQQRHEGQQYGQYGYYGQQQGQSQGQLHGQHQQGGQPQHQAQQQRPNYPSQYGGGYPGGPSTGGFPAASSQSGTPTPPTGFPTYGQPQQSSGESPASQNPPSSPQSGQSPS